MATLSETEIRALTVAVIIPDRPLRGDLREMWVEIARLESGFNTDAVGPKGEIGLWQIHPVHFPALESEGIVNDPEINLKHPVANARAARWVYAKQGFPAWTTATQAGRDVVSRGNVQLDASEDRANQAIEEMMGKYDFGPLDLLTNPGQVVTEIGTATGLGNVWQGLGAFFSIILDPQFWKRIGLGVLGAAIILVAVIFWTQS